MIFIGIAFVVLVLSISMFGISFQLNGINRAVINIPISIFESCIPHFVDEEEGPYFDKKLLNEKLDEYFTYNINQYTTNYTYDVYFYNPTDEAICLGEYCYAVELAFEANLMHSYHYERVMYYQIVGGKYGSK